VVIDCGACVLRRWRADDADSITELLNDRDVWLNLSDRVPFPYLRSHADEFIANTGAKSPAENFAIEVDGRAVGSIGIMLGTGIARVSGEIGYWLGKPYWGRGIATAALKGMTPYAAKTFELTRVFALIFTRNAASARILEKAGYVREGHTRRSVIKDGVVEDEYLYAWYA
jgi:[ribosomal protein S5]-alanine N-acetyltransferase